MSSGCTVDAVGAVDTVDTVGAVDAVDTADAVDPVDAVDVVDPVDVVDVVDAVDAVDAAGGTHDTLRAPLKIDAQRARVVSTAQSVGYAHVTTTSSFQSSSARTTLSTERNAINAAHNLARSSSVSPWQSPDTVGCRCAVAVPVGVVSHSECPRAFFFNHAFPPLSVCSTQHHTHATAAPHSAHAKEDADAAHSTPARTLCSHHTALPSLQLSTPTRHTQHATAPRVH